ncbi:protein TsetseEP-like [Oncorhynchus keta]|uniref:protein TsetseEP-like n=1 Tax=Oncorhynchus keta TaxID=8018 RepID=UPI00227B7CDD|nr:protein TsetseEP-like [Oncorhynchus keta]
MLVNVLWLGYVEAGCGGGEAEGGEAATCPTPSSPSSGTSAISLPSHCESLALLQPFGPFTTRLDMSDRSSEPDCAAPVLLPGPRGPEGESSACVPSDDLPPDSPSGEEGKREGEGELQPQVQPQQTELQAQPQPEPQPQPKPEGTSVGETQQEVTPAASRSPSGGELEQEEGERGDKEEEEIKQKEVVDSQQEQQHEGRQQ